MKSQTITYNDHAVEFLSSKQNVMVNATEMAKIFDKRVENFIRNENTQTFIEECLKNANSRFLGVEKEEDLVSSKQKTGTYMHRILALKFAAWLDPAFELWVYTTIDSLLFGRHVKREQSFEKTLTLQRELDELLFKNPKNGDDFDRFLQIQRELRYEIAIRKSLTSDSITEIKTLFDD